MATTVPWHRTNPRHSEVLIGAAPRGKLFRETGLLHHWIRAHGYQLIPAHRPGVEVTSGAPRTLHYRIHPSGLALARVWSVVLRQDFPTSDTLSRVDIEYPDGTTASAHPALATSTGGENTRRLYVEELSAKSGAVEDVSLTFTQSLGTATIYVESVSCFELPRSVLTLDEVDRGIELEGLRPGSSIFEGTHQSVFGLAEGLAGTMPRRHLLNAWFPEVEVSLGTYTDLLVLPVPVLPAKRFVDDTTSRCRWTVYAEATDGTTAGDVKITTGRSANTDIISVPTSSTTYAFLAEGDINLDCEDMSKADGLPGSSDFETVQIAVRRTAGSGAIRVSGIHLRGDW